jgi:cold shock CspA family protein
MISTPDIPQIADGVESAKKKKDIEIIEYKKDHRFKGRVKFYNEEKKYGFITVQEQGVDPYDVFVYDDALRDANLSLQELKEVKSKGRKVLVTFCKYVYVATNKKPSTKAVDIEVTSNSMN